MPEIHCPMHSRYNHATPILLYEGKKKKMQYFLLNFLRKAVLFPNFLG